MITVSPGLKAEIQKLRGRRLQARVRIDYSDANLDNTVIASGSSIQDNTYFDQLYNGKEDVSSKWASLDGSWRLGEYHLAPSTSSGKQRYEVGWWSHKRTNALGEFKETTGRLYGDSRLYGEDLYGELSVYENVVLTFTERTISSVRVSFDNARGEYAVDFDVSLNDKKGTCLYCLNVTNNTGVKYVQDIPAQNLVASIVITVKKWSHPFRQAKIAEALTSVFQLYNGDDLISLDVIENRELSDESPIGATSSGRCVVTLYNRDRRFDYDNSSSSLFNLIRENVRISPEIGDGTKWIPLGVFFAKSWDISKRSITATVTGVDRMALLGESKFDKSEIIQAPADTTYIIDTDAEWNSGTLSNVAAVSNTLRLAYG